MCKEEQIWNPFEAVNPTKPRKSTILYVHILMHVGNTSKMYEPLSLVVYTHLLSEY